MSAEGNNGPELYISDSDMPEIIFTLDSFDVAHREYIETLANTKLSLSKDNIQNVELYGCVLIVSFRHAVESICNSEPEPDLENRSLQIAQLMNDKYKIRADALGSIMGCDDHYEPDRPVQPLAEELLNEMLEVDNDELMTDEIVDLLTDRFMYEIGTEQDNFMDHIRGNNYDRFKRVAKSIGKHAFTLSQIVGGAVVLLR